jgi:uncharacterized membrane protein
MTRNSEIRKQAREVLKGNWFKAIGLIIVKDVHNVGVNLIIAVLQIILSVITTTVIIRFFFVLSRENNEGYYDIYKFAVNNIWTYFKLIFAIGLKIIAWSLLLIIPGIIAGISYSQALFIKMEDPSIKTFDAIRKSTEMMKGHKGKYFMLGLSFIGWVLLSMLTLGIGMLWVSVYYNTARAVFYNELKFRTAPPVDLSK